MKILFIQLPLIDHSHSYIDGNVAYAPAAISCALSRRFGGEIGLMTLPTVLGNFCSDSIVLRYVANYAPDIVAFTCYVWNIERNLKIATMIRDRLPGTRIVMGGPEIAAGSVLERERADGIDYFVQGEGEWFFSLYLAGADLGPWTTVNGGHRTVCQPPEALLPPGEICEPLTAGWLNAMLDGTVFLELTRGCPYRCSYCYYSKNCATVRELPFELLFTALRSPLAIEEIYILSPTLNATKDFPSRLCELAALNPGIRLHSEMRAAGIDLKMARLLYDAGFRSMEVGLQTLTPAALARVGRTGDPEKELRGMLAMKEAGIDLKIGIIPGLPGDSPLAFEKTIDRLVALGFGDELELYPLHVLPGTRLREEAIAAGVDFLDRPPYYFLGGWGFTVGDMQHLYRYGERATGYVTGIWQLPDFTMEREGLFTGGVRIKGEFAKEWDPELHAPLVETNVFNLHITIGDPNLLYGHLARLLAGLPPDVLYNCILRSEELFDQERIIALMRGLDADSLYRRIHLFHPWREGLRFRFFQVFKERDAFLRADAGYTLLEPILRVDGERLDGIVPLAAEQKTLLIAGGAFARLADLLCEHYREAPESVGFEDMDDQKAFYTRIAQPAVELPYSFRVAGE